MELEAIRMFLTTSGKMNSPQRFNNHEKQKEAARGSINLENLQSLALRKWTGLVAKLHYWVSPLQRDTLHFFQGYCSCSEKTWHIVTKKAKLLLKGIYH